MFLLYDDLSNDTVNSIISVVNHGDHTHVDFHYLMIEDNDSIIWAGTDGGVYRGVFINDSTIEWDARSRGLAVNTIEKIDAYHDDNTGTTLLTSGQFDCGSNTYISANDIDLVLAGYNGDPEFDTIYLNLENSLFEKTAVGWFKHLTGDYDTASAFALTLAAKIISGEQIPEVILKKGSVKNPKTVLIYNQFRNVNHSLILLADG
jgi:hypothetical protein